MCNPLRAHEKVAYIAFPNPNTFIQHEGGYGGKLSPITLKR